MAKKTAGGKDAGEKSAAKDVGKTIAIGAVQQLLDPKVRQQVVDQGLAIAARAQSWRQDRALSRSVQEVDGDVDTDGPLGRFGDRFGQRKLERRTEHLKQSVADLRASRPELTEELAPFFTTLSQIDGALGVANGLPLVKRKKAHHQIDSTLDDLEKTVFQAAMPKLG